MVVGVKNRNTTFEICMSEKEFGDFASAVDVICTMPELLENKKLAEYLTRISELKNSMVLSLNQ